MVFLKTYSTEFNEIIITFVDQNCTTLEIEGKVYLTLLINKQKCEDVLQNQEQENMLKDADFYNVQENLIKQLLNTGLHAVKTTSKKQSIKQVNLYRKYNCRRSN